MYTNPSHNIDWSTNNVLAMRQTHAQPNVYTDHGFVNIAFNGNSSSAHLHESTTDAEEPNVVIGTALQAQGHHYSKARFSDVM